MASHLRTDHQASPSDPDPAAPRPINEAEEIRQRQELPRVLVVEDDFLIAMQTEVALAAAGFEVIGPATTAEEAVVFAHESRPVLAVMDIRLASNRDGIDAARQLYQDLGIRCIFATAHDDAHTRGRAEPYDPLGWLPKPYTMTTLIALVAEALGRLERSR